jgi:hypothetical protein
MFYCQDDAKKNNWPFEFAPKSHGACEICGTVTECADVPSSQLPIPIGKTKGMSFVSQLETTDFSKLSKERVCDVVKMRIESMKSRDSLIEKLEEAVRILKETVKVKDRLVELQGQGLVREKRPLNSF